MKSLAGLPLLIVIVLALGVMPSSAQTLGEFGGTTNDAGMLASQSALAKYHSEPNYLPSIDCDRGANYQTEKLNTGSNFANSGDNSTNFSDTANFAPSDYSSSDFSTSTNYQSANDYSNPTDMPSTMY